jgi:hypothetical protein
MPLYARPAAIVATNRQPHILQPLGTSGLNSARQPVSNQAPAIGNALNRKPAGTGVLSRRYVSR